MAGLPKIIVSLYRLGKLLSSQIAVCCCKTGVWGCKMVMYDKTSTLFCEENMGVKLTREFKLFWLVAIIAACVALAVSLVAPARICA